MGRIPQEVIDSVLDRLDIVEVVSGYIQLKKAGRNFKACCPFHNEKTPSFVVSPDKQIYHCFGCHAGGNLINFVMKYENMDFPEAFRLLAEKAGVELPKFERDPSGEPSLAAKLYQVNEIAAAFYQNMLNSQKGKKALEYLKRRGINAETLEEFKMGYAPNEWESLRRYCQSKKIRADLLRKAGLSIPSEKGKGDYDRFRNRIIFPIFNERGKIVAFGGRVMDDSLPKYINSPETVIYSKSNVLYGLNFSRRGIREEGCAVLTEGYMDVIAPFQYGISNAVATSGTALTVNQVNMLKKYTDTAVMVFDSDQAGEAASLRGLDILVESGMKVRIASLPEGDDPDSYVKNNGKAAFQQIIENAKGLFDYKLDLLVGKLGRRDIGGITDEMLPTIAKVESEVVKSDYLKRLAERLGIHEQSLRHEMKKVKPDYSYHYASEAKVDLESKNYKSSEIHLLGLAMMSGENFKRIKSALGLDKFCDPKVKLVFMKVQKMYEEGAQNINPGKLLSRLEEDEDAKNAAVQALAKADITQEPERALKDCIFCVKKENGEDKLRYLKEMLKKAQKTKDDEQIMDLVVKIKDITDKLNRIHKEKVA
ncbi:MAG: DNA primase [Candidatus Omnitrophica bacterium]|nr:DNA primase [Candidatus Omnitrophota bacterium]